MITSYGYYLICLAKPFVVFIIKLDRDMCMSRSSLIINIILMGYYCSLCNLNEPNCDLTAKYPSNSYNNCKRLARVLNDACVVGRSNSFNSNLISYKECSLNAV